MRSEYNNVKRLIKHHEKKYESLEEDMQLHDDGVKQEHEDGSEEMEHGLKFGLESNRSSDSKPNVKRVVDPDPLDKYDFVNQSNDNLLFWDPFLEIAYNPHDELRWRSFECDFVEHVEQYAHEGHVKYTTPLAAFHPTTSKFEPGSEVLGNLYISENLTFGTRFSMLFFSEEIDQAMKECEQINAEMDEAENENGDNNKRHTYQDGQSFVDSQFNLESEVRSLQSLDGPLPPPGHVAANGKGSRKGNGNNGLPSRTLRSPLEVVKDSPANENNKSLSPDRNSPNGKSPKTHVNRTGKSPKATHDFGAAFLAGLSSPSPIAAKLNLDKNDSNCLFANMNNSLFRTPVGGAAQQSHFTQNLGLKAGITPYRMPQFGKLPQFGKSENDKPVGETNTIDQQLNRELNADFDAVHPRFADRILEGSPPADKPTYEENKIERLQLDDVFGDEDGMKTPVKANGGSSSSSSSAALNQVQDPKSAQPLKEERLGNRESAHSKDSLVTEAGGRPTLEKIDAYVRKGELCRKPGSRARGVYEAPSITDVNNQYSYESYGFTVERGIVRESKVRELIMLGKYYMGQMKSVTAENCCCHKCLREEHQRNLNNTLTSKFRQVNIVNVGGINRKSTGLGDWKKIPAMSEKNKGKFFYYNMATGKQQWDQPAEYIQSVEEYYNSNYRQLVTKDDKMLEKVNTGTGPGLRKSDAVRRADGSVLECRFEAGPLSAEAKAKLPPQLLLVPTDHPMLGVFKKYTNAVHLEVAVGSEAVPVSASPSDMVQA